MSDSPSEALRVRLERVSASDALGRRGGALGRLRAIDWSVGRGLHAVVGAPSDGTVALVGVLSGAVRPASGRCLVDGLEPHRSPAIRGRIGCLEASPTLFGPTVRDVVRQVARGWGADEPAIVARLERLGLAATLERSPASLTVSELRGIELGLALARPAPSLVVLYEPWSLVEGVAPDALREALVATAREACVIVVVSALADVASLADEVWLLDGGRWAARDGGPGWVARSSSTLRVLVHDPAGEVAPSLVDAFSRCLPRAHAVGWSAVAEASDLRRITVTTDDLVEAARRIAQVLAERDVDVRSIETPPRTRAEWLERTSMDRTPRAT